MKRKKHNKTEVYTDAQLTALLKKSEVVISSSKNDNKKTVMIRNVQWKALLKSECSARVHSTTRNLTTT